LSQGARVIESPIRMRQEAISERRAGGEFWGLA
jgi:hypothetical protein